MPYNHPIPDAPIAPGMLPRVAAENLTAQDVLILTQPGNNPGQKNKGLNFIVVSIRGARFIAGVIENQAVTTQKLADEAREV